MECIILYLSRRFHSWFFHSTISIKNKSLSLEFKIIRRTCIHRESLILLYKAVIVKVGSLSNSPESLLSFPTWKSRARHSLDGVHYTRSIYFACISYENSKFEHERASLRAYSAYYEVLFTCTKFGSSYSGSSTTCILDTSSSVRNVYEKNNFMHVQARVPFVRVVYNQLSNRVLILYRIVNRNK